MSNEPKESFDMDSGNVSIENDLPEVDGDELIQIHGRKFHIYDEDSFEPIGKKRGKGA